MTDIRTLLLAAGLAGLIGGPMAVAAPAAWTPPRAADGHPDLSGVWSNASVTLLTRNPAVTALTVEAAQARAMAAGSGLVKRKAIDAEPSKMDDKLPTDGNLQGGYNAFWLESGQTLGRVNGQYRTSWLVDPPNGQLPLTDAGRKLETLARAASFGFAPTDPETMLPWERCLISSRGSGGPGMLNNLYNNNYQIVQTPGAVAIDVEMVHDVRIVPLFANKAAAQAGHGPALIHPWLGDSTGWWEGDALVVETVNVNAGQGMAGPIFLSPKGRVTERFSRASREQIYYAFEVEDPVYYTQTWRAEIGLNAMTAPLYEYACHEGNYAMSGILAAARAADAAPRGK